jgi:hypothetical protein
VAVKTMLKNMQFLQTVEEDRERLKLQLHNTILKTTINRFPFGVHPDYFVLKNSVDIEKK